MASPADARPAPHAVGGVAPAALTPARVALHWASQLVGAAGRALLEARPDDSHTALGFRGADSLPREGLRAPSDALAGEPLPGGLRVAVETTGPAWAVLRPDGRAAARGELVGKTFDEAARALEAGLREAGLSVADGALVKPTYDLPDHPWASDDGVFAEVDAASLTELGRWFGLATRGLEAVAARERHVNTGSHAVRIWPHHFDAAVLLTVDAVVPGTDVHAARSVGVGVSPGDDEVPEPYLYVTPYPAPEDAADRALPDMPHGARWMRPGADGWFGVAWTGTAWLEAATALYASAQLAVMDEVARVGVDAALDLLGVVRPPQPERRDGKVWHRALAPGELAEGRVKSVTCGRRTLCLTHYGDRYAALDNRCPHQGGPLGEGSIEHGLLRCPWHGWDFHPTTGKSPDGFDDGIETFEVEEREDGVWVGLPEAPAHVPTVSDVMARTMTEWGVRWVFGMVGHSNLGLADALRREEVAGNLRYVAIRHEGAASFACSAYGKLTGRPAACLTIAGPGATNLLTGLWDANVDRAPVLALTGQVDTQVLGRGAFQEVDLGAAFGQVARWTQTVLPSSKHAELASLAVKSATVNRGVSHLIFPDEVQLVPAGGAQATGPEGRMGDWDVEAAPRAIEAMRLRLQAAERPLIVVGHGAREDMRAVIDLAEKLQSPVVTTFKAKGQIPDDHPLAGGVLGRSGTPIASYLMNECDQMLVIGASFSNHTGITPKKPIIQIDRDPMALGKFHPVDLPVYGAIRPTLAALQKALASGPVTAGDPREMLAARWKLWRTEKARRRAERSALGLSAAVIFETLSHLVPDDAILPVDVGNNTYSFGRYFETRGTQRVLMSGYLGSIGFALPAALGAWAATQERGGPFAGRKVVSVSGDGGLGQYLAELTTLVRHGMDVTHVVLVNDELGKISKEQRAGDWDVWQTGLVNPSFADFATSCGALGIDVRTEDALEGALRRAIGHPGPSLVAIRQDASLV